MYCPQCGTESSEGLQYCRSCGANLKMIGKAVSLSEAIARSDRGPLPKIKEMIKNLKVEQVSDEISRALEQMGKEIERSSDEPKPPKIGGRRTRTAAQRREKHLTTGAISFFSGIGVATFLYYLTAALVLKLPPEFVAKVPFEIEPVVRMLWLVGLMPMLSGVGHMVAGLLVRPDPPREIDTPKPELETMKAAPVLVEREPAARPIPVSVTERTTSLLEHEIPGREN
ncbi:MAG TPA: zinc ribbon domain-containing protein [Pyrinomonadaceae bacterium]|nr:zinc ribbon domain-containing protein [Pyrinomonadaceae bacterium]